MPSREGLEQLIPTINKLQDVFNSVSGGDSSEGIDLPQIAVVGSQSAGKSSVLEHIVGRDFLPRGNDIVTRRPLILQLFNISSASGTDDDVTEWGEFSHIPDRTFLDFDEIRKEIERETDRLAGGNKGVVADPIALRIYSPKVLNLTLIDLPGITKVPVGDQPQDIEKKIKAIIMSFVENPNCIVLAVTPANSDIANSDALKIARQVDPEGRRTIGILTKVDLMDQGTDVMHILQGKIYPLKLGYIPVVNRGQKDIKDKKRIREALKAEEEFFRNHPVYSSVSSRCGTPYLARTLNRILVNHIRDSLPELRRRIEAHHAKALEKYRSFGGLEGDLSHKSPTVLRLLSMYSKNFCEAFDGGTGEVLTSELFGGASIYMIFHHQLKAALSSVDPCAGLSMQDLRTAIRNAAGTRPALIVSERSFEILVQKAIQNLRQPTLQCIQMVCSEITRIIQKATTLEFSRYPVLMQQVQDVAAQFLNERSKPTYQMVDNLVNIELAYINTSHPDFQAIDSIEKFMERKRSESIARSQRLESSRKASTSASAPSTPMETEEPNRSGILSYLWGGKAKPQSEGLTDALRENQVLRTPISDHEEREIEFIKSLIITYFDIVRKNLFDSVPKSIMFFLVNHLKQNIQNRLVEELYREDKLEELLQEDKDVMAQRMSCKATLDILTRAMKIINEVAESNF